MAGQLVKPPLSAADKRTCDSCLQTLHELVHEIDRAERVGLDVTEDRQHVAFLRDKLMSIKKEYFPGEA